MSKKAFNWLDFVYSVYLGLVCLISGIVLCVNTGELVQNTIEYNFPELRVESYYNDYSQWNTVHSPEEKHPQLTEQERKEMALERAQWNALRDIVDSLVYLIIAGLVFGFHWRLFKHSRLES